MFLFITGCEPKQPLEEVDFKDTVMLREESPLDKERISVCVGSMITPEEGYAYYKRLLDYIGAKLDMQVKFVEKTMYSEVNMLLENGNIDMAFVCGGPYVEGHDEFGLELLAAPVVEGKTVYYSYIIVNKNSGIKKIEELRGKTFAFVDPMSNSGKLSPAHILQGMGETPERFFKEYLYTYSHDNSIKAVAQGVVDGAAVDNLIWEYLDKKGYKYTKETRIINVSEPYGIPPVVVRPSLNKELKARIKKILLEMDRDAEGRQILADMFIDRFAEISDADYDSIRQERAHLEK